MAMRFREIDALLREAESRQELVAVLKGGTAAKEFRREREALEKVVSGKKKLEEADKILAKAKQTHNAILVDAQVAANEITLTTQAEMKTFRSALDLVKQQLVISQDDLKKLTEDLNAKAKKLAEEADILTSREEAANRDGKNLDRREAEVGAREAKATTREAEIKRFDDWRSSAPV